MAEPGRLINLEGPKLGHIPAFDGFRGLFVMQVLLYHALVSDFLKGSPIIIDWFFVASGFLITSLLLDEHRSTGANDLRTFYQRRALRLFPAMYLMIGAFVVIMLLAVTFSQEARDALGPWWVEALAAGTYCYYIVAAFMPGELDGALGHTWSLTVEEQFYFLWPLFLTFTLRKRRRTSDRNLIIGAIAFIVLVMGARVVLHDQIVVPVDSDLHEHMTYFDEKIDDVFNFPFDKDRSDLYVEPTAHMILPNFIAPNIDLRFDYRFEGNYSNDVTRDYENHVAGTRVVGRF